MPIDDRTANLNLQKPNIDNALSDDVARLRSALDEIDTAVAGRLQASSVSAFGLTLIDDADAATARVTLGLGNIDNTSDANKPVSTAQAAADTAALNAAKSYADGIVVGLLDDRGNYDASGSVFPSAGGSGAAGAILKGDLWRISVAGTLGGASVSVGDQIRALTDAPGQTAGNWAITEANLTYVPENAGSKDASGGYVGLSGFWVKLKNAAGSVTSFIASAATVARTWTFPDKDGTVAMTSDITGTNSGTNTGDNAVNSLYSGLVSNANHTGDATGSQALTVVGINGVVMAALATGLLKNTETTGVPSIAVAGEDYAVPSQLFYIGTTQVAINRASGALTLAGITLTTPAIGTPSSGTLTNCTADGTNAVGFKSIPQITKVANGAPTTGADLTYSGKHIYHTSTAGTFTIPANSSVAYPIGTVLTFVNGNGAGVLTIAITTDTMYLAGAGTTGSRSLAANGLASALKTSATTWLISGSGLT